MLQAPRLLHKTSRRACAQSRTNHKKNNIMQSTTITPEKPAVKPERSPIITVLFFFHIAINIVLAIMATLNYYVIDSIEYEFFIGGVCQSAILTTSLILLLCWRFWGFYLFSFGALAPCVFIIAIKGIENSQLEILQSVISVFVLYAILHIKEDGISYWKALRGKI